MTFFNFDPQISTDTKKVIQEFNKELESLKYEIVDLKDAINGTKLGLGGLKIKGTFKDKKNEIVELKEALDLQHLDKSLILIYGILHH